MSKTNSEIYRILESGRIQTAHGPRWKLSMLVNVFHLEWNTRWNTLGNIESMLQKNEAYLMTAINRYNARHKHQIEPKWVFQDIIEDHVATFNSDFQITLPDGHPYLLTGVSGVDAYVSRFAAWAILSPDLPIDGGLFARTYFMDPWAPYTEINQNYLKFGRIFARNYLTNAEKIVNSIAKEKNLDIRKLRHAMNADFFGTSDTDTIKMANNIPVRNKDSISNYLDVSTLLAKHSALNTAIKRYRELLTRDNDGTLFATLLLGELRNKRYKMLNRLERPEQNLCPTPVQQLKTECLNRSLAFIKQQVGIMK